MRLNESVVRGFWRLFDQGNFEEAEELMLPEAVVRWPNTREIFRGRTNFILANKKYPGHWKISLEELHTTEEKIISVVKVENNDLTESFYATSFFSFENGLIKEIIEYWGDNGEPPQWRLDEKLSERF